MADAVTSTELILAGSEKESTWIFEEHLIDPQHCVTVCREVSTTSTDKSQPFHILSTDDILSVDPIYDAANVSDWMNFDAKAYSAR